MHRPTHTRTHSFIHTTHLSICICHRRHCSEPKPLELGTFRTISSISVLDISERAVPAQETTRGDEKCGNFEKGLRGKQGYRLLHDEKMKKDVAHFTILI